MIVLIFGIGSPKPVILSCVSSRWLEGVREAAREPTGVMDLVEDVALQRQCLAISTISDTFLFGVYSLNLSLLFSSFTSRILEMDYRRVARVLSSFSSD